MKYTLYTFIIFLVMFVCYACFVVIIKFNDIESKRIDFINANEVVTPISEEFYLDNLKCKIFVLRTKTPPSNVKIINEIIACENGTVLKLN